MIQLLRITKLFRIGKFSNHILLGAYITCIACIYHEIQCQQVKKASECYLDIW